MGNEKKLTDKQAAFVDEYLKDLNATQAAIRAGYSEATANREGSRLLSNVDIQSLIAERQNKRSERTQITQDMVLRELALVAFADMANYVTIEEGGAMKMLTFDEMPEGASRVVSGIKEKTVITETEGGKKINKISNVEYKHHDKMKALDLLGKHLGMFKDGSGATVTDFMNILIKGVNAE